MSQTTTTPITPDPNVPIDAQVDGHEVQRGALFIARAVSWVLLAYLVVVQIILFLGFILHLLGADPTSSFVQWCYRNLDSAMRPFRGIFQPIELGTTANDVPATLETSILFAMIIYGILALLVNAGVTWLAARVRTLDAEEQRQRAMIMRRQELQALNDRAEIARAQQAAMAQQAAAAQQAATRQVADDAARQAAEAVAAQQTGTPPPPPTAP